jgi:DNA-binding transcriptional MerR regulator
MMQALPSASAQSSVPRKLFYRINEVAKLTGLKPYVLRYWESEFPELAPEKDASDQRRYRAQDIETIFAIRKLLYEDRFTIKGARQRLKTELKQMKRSAGPGGVDAPRPAKAAPSDHADDGPHANLGRTLYHLRSEVDELLKILGR